MQRTDSSVDRCESPVEDTSSFRTFRIDTMAEAQRLIGISLAKIAQSRVCRGGVSLHKNLLVATVLQKARYIFMEEAYHIVHGHYLQQNKCMELEMEKQRAAAAAATAAAAAASVNNNVDDESCSESEDSDESESYASSETNDESDTEDKENSPPASQNANEDGAAEVQAETAPSTLEEVKKVEKENSGNKRRRDAVESETEEAVQSILPKRHKSESDQEQSSADATALSETVSSQLEAEDLSRQPSSAESLPHTPSVESIDRITSLVSIFSFGNLSRSVSTPDFCAAQAKDSDNALTQLQQHSQRGYLTMTV